MQGEVDFSHDDAVDQVVDALLPQLLGVGVPVAAQPRHQELLLAWKGSLHVLNDLPERVGRQRSIEEGLGGASDRFGVESEQLGDAVRDDPPDAVVAHDALVQDPHRLTLEGLQVRSARRPFFVAEGRVENGVPDDSFDRGCAGPGAFFEEGFGRGRRRKDTRGILDQHQRSRFGVDQATAIFQDRGARLGRHPGVVQATRQAARELLPPGFGHQGEVLIDRRPDDDFRFRSGLPGFQRQTASREQKRDAGSDPSHPLLH